MKLLVIGAGLSGLLVAERRGITGRLRAAYAATPPAPFESLAAWTGRLGAPARVAAFLTAYAQCTPVPAPRPALRVLGELARLQAPMA
jgi:hypothetical protein